MSRPVPRPARRRAVTVGVAALTVGICVATPVVATTGDNLREGVRNGTATKETQIISRVAGAQLYGTRQSNVSTGANAGGAAIYGCRRPSRECTRHVNLDKGPAAAFVTDGTVPFTVTANGLVANLNADLLDGLNAAQIVTEARSGKAASAATADVATRAVAVDTVTTPGRLAFSAPTASNADPAVARTAATEVPLFTRGPLSVYGKCFTDTTAGTVNAEVFARTSANGAVLDGQTDNLTGNPAFLDTASAEDARQIDVASTGANSVNADLDEEMSSLVAPDGSIVQLHAQLVAKSGNLPAGDGPYGAGDRCGFGLTVIG